MTEDRDTKETSVDLAQIAQRLGAAEKEIVDFVEDEIGIVISHVDGTKYVDVPENKPDADGKTGLMFLKAPMVGGKPVATTFPVFASQLSESVAPVATEPEPAPAAPVESTPPPTVVAPANPAPATAAAAPPEGDVVVPLKAVPAPGAGV